MSNVCFVRFLRLLTWKPGWERPFDTLIQSSSTASVSTWVSFVIWCRLVPSGLLNTLVSFSLPRTLVLRGSLLMRGRATDIFLRRPAGLFLTGEGLAMSNFRKRLRTHRTGLWGRPILRTRFIKCASLDGYKRFFFFSLSTVFASEVGCAGKNGQPKTTCSRLFGMSCPYNIASGLLLGGVFLSRCHGPLHARGKCRFSSFCLS